MSSNEQEKRAVQIFVQQGLCASPAEAEAILDHVIWDDAAAFADSMALCFDLTEEAVGAIYAQICKDSDDSSSNGQVEESPDALPITEEDDDEDDDDDDGNWIGEGECELCERTIPLTRHHLIPRSTWPRYETRLLNALAALDGDSNDNGDGAAMEKATIIAGEGFAHLLADYQSEKRRYKSNKNAIHLPTDRQLVRQMLQRVCLICGKCHGAIHRTHDNMTLGMEYNTVDKLIADPKIYKFCKWASKQRRTGAR